MITLGTKLSSLNRVDSIWHFNTYLRVTFVAADWLVVWDHRKHPPTRYDFKAVGDHQTICDLAARQLQTLASEDPILRNYL